MLTNSYARRLSRSVAMIGILGAVAACGTEPDALPAGAEAVTALPDYQAWWAKTEACSGLQGEFVDLRFYQVPGVATFNSAVGTVVGLWSKEGSENRITIAGQYLDNELVVRHEMLHALLEKNGHPPEYFVQKCGLTWASWTGNAGSASGAAAAAAILHND